MMICFAKISFGSLAQLVERTTVRPVVRPHQEPEWLVFTLKIKTKGLCGAMDSASDF